MKGCLIWQWLYEVLAPGYSLWDQLGKLCKKHNSRVWLWRLAWRWKMSDDCPLSETLKALHFYRRRNLKHLSTGAGFLPSTAYRSHTKLKGSFSVAGDSSGDNLPGFQFRLASYFLSCWRTFELLVADDSVLESRPHLWVQSFSQDDFRMFSRCSASNTCSGSRHQVNG